MLTSKNGETNKPRTLDGKQIMEWEDSSLKIAKGNENQEHKNLPASDHSSASQFIKTLADVVIKNSCSDHSPKNDKVFATWYNHKGKAKYCYTYKKMWNEAGAIAHTLRVDMDLEKGDRVVLCYSFGLQFFAAFLGCIRAGITAVLVYPPNPRSLVLSIPKMTLVAEDCDAKIILVDDEIYRLITFDRKNPISKSRHLWPKHISFKNLHSDRAHEPKVLNCVSFDDPTLSKMDIAFLQYTSGSTGKPKGVMVSFGALEANVAAILQYARVECENSGLSFSDATTLSWVPQYHDMGLIGASIAPFAAGWSCNMISPITFIQNPVLFIELLSRLKVNFSLGPDFGYALAARKFNEQRRHQRGKEPIKDLDLSSVILLQNGAEPIRSETVTLFGDTFCQYNLNERWFSAIYGMAEMVVCISSLREYRLSRFEPTPGRPSIAVAHRRSLPDEQDIQIVCPSTYKILEDGEVGEIWLSGPSTTLGYFNQERLTSSVFQCRIMSENTKGDNNQLYLRSGDLGFFEDDYLFICGREKDVIIVNGANYYPQDIELTVQNASPTIRPGCIAAFSSNDTHGDGKLVIVFEIRAAYVTEGNQVVNEAHSSIVRDIGLVPSRIVAIKEKGICKTTSGKIQRKATRLALQNNELPIVHELVLGNENTTTAGSTNFDQSDLPTDSFSQVVLDTVKTDQADSTKTRTNFDPSDRTSVTTKQNIIEGEANLEVDTFDKIMHSFFGKAYHADMTWNEGGMTSLLTIEIRDAISASYNLLLDPDCFDIFSTPAALKSYVTSNEGVPLQTYLPSLNELKSAVLPRWLFGWIQAICVLVLLLFFCCSIVPAWFAGKLLFGVNGYRVISALDGESSIVWVYFPLVVPVWMLSFSICTIALKWLVIGRYREGEVAVFSTRYLQWWMVDRFVEVWNVWVGRFLLDTPLINVFYAFMGANLDWTASVDSFVSEFDLVEVKEYASVEYPIKCRMFGEWSSNVKPTLRFRSISIGKQSTLKGFASPGTAVGDRSTIKKLASVPEGAIVPDFSEVSGSPGFITKTPSAHKQKQTTHNSGAAAKVLEGGLKLLWIVLELYMFFGVAFLGEYFWLWKLPDWRFSPVLHWFSLLLWFNLVSIWTSILIKWVFIGKRKPGPVNDSVWRKVADWAADWHFRTSLSLLLFEMTAHSHMWNIVLMMHGMDTDMVSKLHHQLYLPSKVDLVRVRNSFVNVISYDVKQDNKYQSLQIEDSSVGYKAHLSTDSNLSTLQVSNAVIPPYSYVSNAIVKQQKDPRAIQMNVFQALREEVAKAIGYLLFFAVVFATLLPSYELWVLVNGSGDPDSIWLAVLTLALCLILHTCCMVLALVFIERSLLPTHTKEDIKRANNVLYVLYQSANFFVQSYSLFMFISGSPIYNQVIRLAGGCVDKDVIFLSSKIYEHSKLSIAKRTIIDTVHVASHQVVYQEVSIGSCTLSGLVHPSTYVTCTSVTGVSGPMHAYIGEINGMKGESQTSKNPQDTVHRNDNNTFDRENIDMEIEDEGDLMLEEELYGVGDIEEGLEIESQEDLSFKSKVSE